MGLHDRDPYQRRRRGVKSAPTKCLKTLGSRQLIGLVHVAYFGKISWQNIDQTRGASPEDIARWRTILHTILIKRAMSSGETFSTSFAIDPFSVDDSRSFVEESVYPPSRHHHDESIHCPTHKE